MLARPVHCSPEVKRGEVGWTSEQAGKWSIESYQNAVDWRVSGLAYDPSIWAITRKKSSPHGCWLRLQKVGARQDAWLGSIYVPPQYGTGDLQQAVQDHCSALPATTLPTLLFGDVNAQIKWQSCDGARSPYGDDSKARVLLDTLTPQGLHLNAPERNRSTKLRHVFGEMGLEGEQSIGWHTNMQYVTGFVFHRFMPPHGGRQ